MTIKELDQVCKEDIYIRSLWGEYETYKPDKTITLNNVLRSSTGIMNLEVKEMYFSPHNNGLIVSVDLPPKMTNALFGIK